MAVSFRFVHRRAPLCVRTTGLALRVTIVNILLTVIIKLIYDVVGCFEVPMLHRVIRYCVRLSEGAPLLVRLFFLCFNLPGVKVILDSRRYTVAKLAFLKNDCVTRTFQDNLSGIPPVRIRSTLDLKVDGDRMFAGVVLPRTMSGSVPTFYTGTVFLVGRASMFDTMTLTSLVFIAGSLVKVCCGASRTLFVLMVTCLVVLLPVSLVYSFMREEIHCTRCKS